VIQELLNGKVHALLAGTPLPTYQALKHPDKLFLPVKGTITGSRLDSLCARATAIR